MRRSIFAVTAVVVSLFASQCLAADDQKPSDQSTAGRPVIAPDAHLKAVSNATPNRLMKYDGSGLGSDSLVSESGGDVFLLQPSGRLFFYPNINGTYINGTSTSMLLHGYGGTITLTNADTVVNGFGTGAWSTALTVNGSGTSSATAGLAVNNSAGTSLLYVRNDGNVGIGTAGPTSKLEVAGTARFGTDFLTMPNPTYGGVMIGEYGGGATGELQFLAANAGGGYGYRLFGYAGDGSFRLQRRENSASWSDLMTFTSGGSIGIGTTTPGAGLTPATQEAPLHIYSTQDKNTFFMVQNPTNSLNAVAIVRTQADTASMNFASHATSRTVSRYGLTLGGWNEVLSWVGNGLVIGTSNTTPLVLGTNSADRIHINANGNVGINTNNPLYTLEVNGTIKATQVIGATYQDVAEWVPATTHMEPGTVVVLNRDHKNEVMPSAHPYDTAVAGVVSAQPGLILGEASDSKAQIATTGRVKVRVDATAGPIEIGDLLVTSDKAGMAMKSQPVELSGISMHRPGTLIGKALEPLDRGQGEILVLLSLQ